MTKVVAIVQVRMGSTRLQGKIFKDICSKPLIWHVVERIRHCKKVDQIVLATTEEDIDLKIVEYAKENSLGIFRGSTKDVLSRFIGAARKYNADIIIRICSDSPFIDPSEIDKLIEKLILTNADFVTFTPGKKCIHQGFFVFKKEAIEKVGVLAETDYHREHVTVYFKEYPEKFKIEYVDPQKEFQRNWIKLSVDTEKNLEKVRFVYSNLYSEGSIVDFSKALELLETMDNNRLIFRLDADPYVGLGHLMRCLSIAKHLKNDYEVIFAVSEDETNKLIKSQGYDIVLKTEGEKEESFINRICSDIKPKIIVFDIKYNYSRNDVESIKIIGVKLVFIDMICPGISFADEIIFPIAHLDVDKLKPYLSEDRIARIRTGWEYIVLRDEIIKLKEKRDRLLIISDKLVVTSGGSDPEAVLITLARMLSLLNWDFEVILLYGSSFSHLDELNSLSLPNNFKIKPYDLEELLDAQLVISTFGISVYEMLYLNIPTLVVSHSLTYSQDANILAKKTPITYLGFIKNLKVEKLSQSIKKIKSKSFNYPNINSNADEKIAQLINKIY